MSSVRRRLLLALFLTALGGVALAVTILSGPAKYVIASSEDGVFVVPREGDTIDIHLVFPSPGATGGLLHYTEHLVRRSILGRDTAIMDQDSNAWTSQAAVGYWFSGDGDDLPALLEMLRGTMDPIDAPRPLAASERGIVLREHALRVEQDIDRRANQALTAFLYDGNAMAAPVLGQPEQIARFDYDAARDLHAATHRSEVARLVVIGDVTLRGVRRLMGEIGWPKGQSEPVAPPAFELGPSDRTTLTFPEPDTAARVIWGRIVSLPEPIPYDRLEAHAALLQSILDSNLPEGLAGPLRFDARLARAFDVSIWPIDERHIDIRFSARPDAGVPLTDLATAFEAALEQAVADGLSRDSYDRALGRFDGVWPDWSDREYTKRWMADYVLDRVSDLRVPLDVADLKRLEDDLSRDITETLLRALSDEGRTAIAFIGPEEIMP